MKLTKKPEKHAPELIPNLLTHSIETPEVHDLSKPDGWHKRINVPFEEYNVVKSYRKILKKVKETLLLGMTKKEKNKRNLFKCMFRYNNVYSEHGIYKVRRIVSIGFRVSSILLSWSSKRI